MTGVHRTTVLKLLAELGRACSIYQDRVFRNLRCERIQCDEIWSFCYAKAKNLPSAKKAPEGAGDVWTWTALDADTKLVPCWYVGTRDVGAAWHFIQDLKDRLAERTQITTDGYAPYKVAIEGVFGSEVDFAQLVKIYGKPEANVSVRPVSSEGVLEQHAV